MIDDRPVDRINADLTSGVDVTIAKKLPENTGIAFRGPGTAPFDIPGDLAANMLAEVGNPNQRPNSDVIMPVRNGQDLSSRPRGHYTINFADMTLAEAALYAAPFEHARQAVIWQGRDLTGNYWQYRQSARNMTAALSGLSRFVGHSVTAKHLTFVWVDAGTICNSATNVFARDDDYFFGILHSRIHEVWARALGTQLREAESAFRYTPTTCFETFPFPQPTDEQRAAIAAAAVELNRLRENWLNPVNAEGGPALNAGDLRRRTLTGLYNQRPTWLDNAHRALDAAVADAYGWGAADVEDAAILAGLLALNLGAGGWRLGRAVLNRAGGNGMPVPANQFREQVAADQLPTNFPGCVATHASGAYARAGQASAVFCRFATRTFVIAGLRSLSAVTTIARSKLFSKVSATMSTAIWTSVSFSSWAFQVAPQLRHSRSRVLNLLITILTPVAARAAGVLAMARVAGWPPGGIGGVIIHCRQRLPVPQERAGQAPQVNPFQMRLAKRINGVIQVEAVDVGYNAFGIHN